MRACMTASGGVMFIPDTIARKKCKASYQSLVENEVTERQAAMSKGVERKNLFGRREPLPAWDKKAA